MNFNDVQEFFSVGSKIKVISHGESVVGTLVKLSAPTIVLRRDNGKIKILDCEKIETLDEIEDTSSQILSVRDGAPTEMTIEGKVLLTPLIYPTQLPQAPFLHRDEIKARFKEYRDAGELKELRSAWNQLDNILEAAKKSKSLALRQNQILRQLKELLNDYPFEVTYTFAGDVYSACNQWARAALAYSKAALHSEAIACASKVADTKNFLIEVLRRQLLDKDNRNAEALRMFFYCVAEVHCRKIAAELLEKISDDLTDSEREIACQGCYKILADSGEVAVLNWSDFDYSAQGLRQLIETLRQVGRNDSPLELLLPDLKNAQPAADPAIRKGKLTMFKSSTLYGFIDEKIFFHLRQVEDKNLRTTLNNVGLWRDDIKVTYILAEGKNGASADHIKLLAGETLPPVTTEIYDGILESYDLTTDFGRVVDTSNGKRYGFKLAAVLNPCLRRYLQDTFYIREFHIQFTLKVHRNKTVVRNLRLTDQESAVLNSEYSLTNVQPPLIDDASKNLPEYQPLPPLREEKTSVAVKTKESPFITPKPKLYTQPIYYDVPESNAFEQGCRYLDEKKYAKAAECFEESIRNENFFEKSLKNLMTIYKVDYGEDINKQVDKGLQLLDRYAARLDEITVVTERIQLLDKAKRKEELIAALRRIIEISFKINQRLHYRFQLAREYQLKNDFTAAIDCYETWLKEKQRNRSKLSVQWDHIELKAKQNMAVCFYLKGDKTRAKKIADELLRDMPDNQLLRDILDDQMHEAKVEKVDLDVNLFGDNDLSPLPPYAKFLLDGIPLEKTYSTTYHRVFKGRFDKVFVDDDFLGVPKDVAEIRQKISENLQQASDKERSEAWAFLSKLVSKAYARNSGDYDACDRNKIKPFWEHVYAAQAMGYAGDYELQQQLDCKVDVARFFYIQNMNIMPERSDFDTRSYFVKFVASFFLEPNEVLKLKPSSRDGKDKNVHLTYLGSYSECRDARQLLTGTFSFPNGDKMQKWISEFIVEMAKYPQWRTEAEKIFVELLQESISLTENNFKTIWQRAKEEYLRDFDKFAKNLRDARNNYDNTSDGGLSNYLDKITTVLEENLLIETDQKRVRIYCELLLRMSKVADKSTFEEKEDEFKKIIEDSADLMKIICKKPTKLSYETIHENLEYINFRAEEELTKLYESSVPDLKIQTNIVGAEPVQFIVTVENKDNCQTAVNLKIEVDGMGGGVAVKNIRKNTGAVRGGSSLEVLYEADLGDKEKSQGYFEVAVRVTYRYRIAKDDTEEKTVERNFNISILNGDDYEEIDNVYSSIAKTNGVPTESKLFYGRNEDIDKIVHMLRLKNGTLMKHRGIVMYGQKRAGKTSIMNHLKQKIRDTYGADAYVTVEIGSVGVMSSQFQFLSTMIGNLEWALRKDHRELFDFLKKNNVSFPCDKIESDELSEDARMGHFRRTLQNVIEMSREFGNSDDKFIPLFLIDEFTHFYQWIKNGNVSADFMKFWKGFLANNPICTIVIGMDHMPQFMEEYENEFACMDKFLVSFLKPNDTQDLANNPILLEDGSSRYKEDALGYIYQLTAGSAYLTVVFCDAFVDYLNKRKTTYITRTVIDNFIHEELLGKQPILERLDFDPQLNDPGKFSEQEQTATYEDNKAVLTYIALHADKATHELSGEKIRCIDRLSEKTSARLEMILNQLTRRRVLCKSGNNYYKIEIGLLRMWLLREIGEDF